MPYTAQTIKPSRAKLIRDLKQNMAPEAIQTLSPDATKSQQPAPPSESGGSTASKLESYPCITQKPTPAAFAGQTNIASLQPELAVLAATKLNEATTEWNALNIGAQFAWAEKIEDAAFVLTFADQVSPGTLAEAFFPSDVDLNQLNVYAAAFKPGTVQYLKNIFLHELGHVLGLRHEFAPEKEKSIKSVQVGPRNPTSVMSYEFPPQIQTTDVDSTKVFY
ncbi:hypothetical protein BDW74DRAFT_180184 [Aspergillus multicolor]|uniref:uncharacterized protein n=1 Tax=Aspergillus multicolor TaxID=41759 RepID=UPI003CCDF4D8